MLSTPPDAGKQYAALITAAVSADPGAGPMIWRSRAAIQSARTFFACTSLAEQESARCILFAALCDGIILDDDDLAHRVKARLDQWPKPEQRQRRRVEPMVPSTGFDASKALDQHVDDALDEAA
jgi:hypothetical protein